MNSAEHTDTAANLAREKPKVNNKLRPTSIEWNDTALIMACHGKAEVILNVLRDAKLDEVPSKTAVYMWVSRKKIPDRWRASYVYALMVAGKITSNEMFKRGKSTH